MIKNIQKLKFGTFGTVEFELSAKGHRGFQEFMFYPSDIVGADNIAIQSDKRYGHYFPKTGKILLSKSRGSGSYSHSFRVDQMNGQVTQVVLSEGDKEEMNKWLVGSAKNTGGSCVIIDNSQAGSQI